MVSHAGQFQPHLGHLIFVLSGFTRLSILPLLYHEELPAAARQQPQTFAAQIVRHVASWRHSRLSLDASMATVAEWSYVPRTMGWRSAFD